MTVKLRVPAKLAPVFVGPYRYRCAWGGRGSAKTRTFAKMLAVKGAALAQEGKSGIVIAGREFMNSLADSSFAEVAAAIAEEPWLSEWYDVGQNYIRTKCKSIDIVFCGLRHNLASIKSKARIHVIWVDEAESVSEEAWRTVIPTVREDESEIWVTWNPLTEGSPTDTRFRKNPPTSSIVVEMNWSDNPWFPSVLEMERQDSLAKDDEEIYMHVWEGGYLSVQGRPVFQKGHTKKALLECWTPDKRMALELGKFIENNSGELRVWFEPEDGKKYAIGADVAEGLEKGDYSCADVIDIATGQQVAQWHGHIAPDLFGHVIYALGIWYNKALVGVECNNHGLTTNVVLRDANYPNLYVQKAIDDGYSGDREQTRIGWMTTSKSKPYIIDQLSKDLREGTHGICCKETVQECQTYIVQPNGSYGAQDNCFDDRVMSYAIAKEMARQ